MLKQELEQINEMQRKEIQQANDKNYALNQQFKKLQEEYEQLAEKYENVLLNLAGLNFKEKFTYERPDGLKEEVVQIPGLDQKGIQYHRF